jgi:hypothetical protein
MNSHNSRRNFPNGQFVNGDGHFPTRGGARQLCGRSRGRRLVAFRGGKANHPVGNSPRRASHQPHDATFGAHRRGENVSRARARDSCCDRVRGSGYCLGTPFAARTFASAYLPVHCRASSRTSLVGFFDALPANYLRFPGHQPNCGHHRARFSPIPSATRCGYAPRSNLDTRTPNGSGRSKSPIRFVQRSGVSRARTGLRGFDVLNGGPVSPSHGIERSGQLTQDRTCQHDWSSPILREMLLKRLHALFISRTSVYGCRL